MSTKAGIQFLHDSEHRFMEKSAEELGFPQPAPESEYEPSLQLFDLPAIDSIQLPHRELWEVMQSRKTLRRYQSTPLSLDELTILLWYSQGVKSVTDRQVTMRTVPSAGARHPLETYLLVSKVDGLPQGMYRYQAIPHQLALLKQGDHLADGLSREAVHQNHVRECAVSFWWAVDSIRTTWRYSTRAYRYILMDSGHACENLILAAEGIGCGACAIGSFDDGLVNDFFGMDGQERFVIYGATVGKR